MGSRTAWRIINNVDAVTWLYSHWGGESKFSDTQSALISAMPRWEDRSYGARIFISQIIGKNWDLETGFGISSTGFYQDSPFEESYFDTTIDFINQTVQMGSRQWSFSQFIHAEDCSDELVENFYGKALS
jgi:hypothetical protein